MAEYYQEVKQPSQYGLTGSDFSGLALLERNFGELSSLQDGLEISSTLPRNYQNTRLNQAARNMLQGDYHQSGVGQEQNGSSAGNAGNAAGESNRSVIANFKRLDWNALENKLFKRNRTVGRKNIVAGHLSSRRTTLPADLIQRDNEMIRKHLDIDVNEERYLLNYNSKPPGTSAATPPHAKATNSPGKLKQVIPLSNKNKNNSNHPYDMIKIKQGGKKMVVGGSTSTDGEESQDEEERQEMLRNESILKKIQRESQVFDWHQFSSRLRKSLRGGKPDDFTGRIWPQQKKPITYKVSPERYNSNRGRASRKFSPKQNRKTQRSPQNFSQNDTSEILIKPLTKRVILLGDTAKEGTQSGMLGADVPNHTMGASLPNFNQEIEAAGSTVDEQSVHQLQSSDLNTKFLGVSLGRNETKNFRTVQKANETSMLSNKQANNSSQKRMSPRLNQKPSNIQLQLDQVASSSLPNNGTITRKMLEKILESTDKSWLQTYKNQQDDAKHLNNKKVQMDVILTQTQQQMLTNQSSHITINQQEQQQLPPTEGNSPALPKGATTTNQHQQQLQRLHQSGSNLSNQDLTILDNKFKNSQTSFKNTTQQKSLTLTFNSISPANKKGASMQPHQLKIKQLSPKRVQMKEVSKEKAKYQATDRLPEYQNLTSNSPVVINVAGVGSNDPDLTIEIEVQNSGPGSPKNLNQTSHQQAQLSQVAGLVQDKNRQQLYQGTQSEIKRKEASNFAQRNQSLGNPSQPPTTTLNNQKIIQSRIRQARRSVPHDPNNNQQVRNDAGHQQVMSLQPSQKGISPFISKDERKQMLMARSPSNDPKNFASNIQQLYQEELSRNGKESTKACLTADKSQAASSYLNRVQLIRQEVTARKNGIHTQQKRQNLQFTNNGTQGNSPLAPVNQSRSSRNQTEFNEELMIGAGGRHGESGSLRTLDLHVRSENSNNGGANNANHKNTTILGRDSNTESQDLALTPSASQLKLVNAQMRRQADLKYLQSNNPLGIYAQKVLLGQKIALKQASVMKTKGRPTFVEDVDEIQDGLRKAAYRTITNATSSNKAAGSGGQTKNVDGGVNSSILGHRNRNNVDLSVLDSGGVNNQNEQSSIVYSPLKCIEIEKQVQSGGSGMAPDETPKSFKFGKNTMNGYNNMGQKVGFYEESPTSIRKKMPLDQTISTVERQNVLQNSPKNKQTHHQQSQQPAEVVSNDLNIFNQKSESEKGSGGHKGDLRSGQVSSTGIQVNVADSREIVGGQDDQLIKMQTSEVQADFQTTYSQIGEDYQENNDDQNLHENQHNMTLNNEKQLHRRRSQDNHSENSEENLTRKFSNKDQQSMLVIQQQKQQQAATGGEQTTIMMTMMNKSVGHQENNSSHQQYQHMQRRNSVDKERRQNLQNVAHQTMLKSGRGYENSTNGGTTTLQGRNMSQVVQVGAINVKHGIVEWQGPDDSTMANNSGLNRHFRGNPENGQFVVSGSEKHPKYHQNNNQQMNQHGMVTRFAQSPLKVSHLNLQTIPDAIRTEQLSIKEASLGPQANLRSKGSPLKEPKVYSPTIKSRKVEEVDVILNRVGRAKCCLKPQNPEARSTLENAVGDGSDYYYRPSHKASKVRYKFLQNNFLQNVTEDFMSIQTLERNLDGVIVRTPQMFHQYEIYAREEMDLVTRLYKRFYYKTIEKKFGYLKKIKSERPEISGQILCAELELNPKVLRLSGVITAFNKDCDLSFLPFLKLMSLFLLRKDVLVFRIEFMLKFLGIKDPNDLKYQDFLSQKLQFFQFSRKQQVTGTPDILSFWNKLRKALMDVQHLIWKEDGTPFDWDIGLRDVAACINLQAEETFPFFDFLFEIV